VELLGSSLLWPYIQSVCWCWCYAGLACTESECVCVCERKRERHEHTWQDRAQIFEQKRTGVQTDPVPCVCVTQ